MNGEEEEKMDGEDACITLKQLYLDNNGCGKEGMQRLARALKSSTTIGNGIGC